MKLKDLLLAAATGVILYRLLEVLDDFLSDIGSILEGRNLALGDSEDEIPEAEEERVCPGLEEIREYQEYINSQLFSQNDEAENYWAAVDEDELLEEGGDFFSESVHINDPRITDEQREAIMREIERHGIDPSNVNFDVSAQAAQEEFYNFNPVMGDRIIFAVTPWGEVISSMFSEDHMRMAYEVSEIEDKPVDDIILEVMAERYNIAKGLE